MLSAGSHSPDDTKRASDELFLNELKLQFENLLRLKEGLENRANNLVVVSATIATLLFGFAAFSYSNIQSANPYFYWILLPLGISIGFSIATMGFGLYASRLAKYELPIAHKEFFNDDGTKKTDLLDAYRDSSEIM